MLIYPATNQRGRLAKINDNFSFAHNTPLLFGMTEYKFIGSQGNLNNLLLMDVYSDTSWRQSVRMRVCLKVQASKSWNSL